MHGQIIHHSSYMEAAIEKKTYRPNESYFRKKSCLDLQVFVYHYSQYTFKVLMNGITVNIQLIMSEDLAL